MQAAIKKPLILVEDDMVDQMMVKKAMTELKFAHELLIFSDGEEVINYLKGDGPRPFLIISDVNMPKMGGIELLKEIQTDESLRYKGRPFVVLSTTSNASDMVEAYKYGVQGFFEKSVQYREFVRLLGRIIEYWQECKFPE